MEEIIKIVKFLEDHGLLSKAVSEAIENEAKQQKGGFLTRLLGTFGAILLGNMLEGKGIKRAGKGIVRDGCGPKKSLINDF